ncbi:MAG: hypothetical protein NVS3B20_02120 [Polyangiales bacterium]
MRPRYTADYKTLLWLALASVNAAVIWFLPHARIFLVPVACYFALCAGLVAHNHNHCPTFKSRRLNDLLNHWATIFYGFAAFNWIPTHNNNHHKFTNAPRDATITWRFSNKHNALVAFTYPFVSMVSQAPLISAYVKEMKTRKPAHHRQIMIQLALCWGLPIALTLVDWRAAVAALWIPRFASLYLIIYFNYGQHVHCDPYSKWNHSRSFTSPVLNFLLFNNGYHSVHHLKAGAHWSLTPKMHEQFGGNIDPVLNVKSFWVWAIKQYILSPFIPSLGTQQIGRAPFDPPPKVETVESVGEAEIGELHTA